MNFVTSRTESKTLFKGIFQAVVVPFSKPFFPELHGLFAAHLSHNDLRSYSIVSRALNREASRILWRCVHVLPLLTQPPGVIEAFACALKRYPVRAACILRFRLTAGDGPWKRRSVFPDQPTEQQWESLEEAFRLLVRVKTVELMLAVEEYLLDLNDRVYPQRFLDIISNVFAASAITTFSSHLHLDRTWRLCQAWPTLVGLSTPRPATTNLVDLSPDALPRLRHVELDIRSMVHIVKGRPLETIYQFIPEIEPIRYDDYDSSDFERIAAIIRCCKTLLRARAQCVFHWQDIEDLSGLLSAFTHDNLRHLDLYVVLCAVSNVDVDGGLFRFMCERIMQALPPGGLAHLPKLEYLRIIFDIPGLHAMHVEDSGTDTDDVANTLVECLDSGAHLTLARVEIEWCWDFYKHLSNMSFLATSYESHWDTGYSHTKRLEYPTVDDVF